ncbi:hypothetical protein YC2023_011628 [Brassica napus]
MCNKVLSGSAYLEQTQWEFLPSNLLEHHYPEFLKSVFLGEYKKLFLKKLIDKTCEDTNLFENYLSTAKSPTLKISIGECRETLRERRLFDSSTSSLSLSLSSHPKSLLLRRNSPEIKFYRERSSSSSPLWPCLRSRRNKATIRPHRWRYFLLPSSSVLHLSSSSSILFLYCHQTVGLKP